MHQIASSALVHCFAPLAMTGRFKQNAKYAKDDPEMPSPRVNALSRVVFVGQFPPPINGLTLITARLASALERAGRQLTVVDIGGPPRRKSLTFHMSRLARVSRALGVLAASAVRGDRICYLTADGGLGLVYSLLIAGTARLLGFRIFVHHHTYSYIVRERLLTRAFVAVCGPAAVSIFLSRGMAGDFAARYGRQTHSLVLPNAIFVPAPPLGEAAVCREITIGLLGNLAAEKGLHHFLEVLRLAREAGLPLCGVLAGPVAADADRTFLASLAEELAGRLDYRGPVYDAEKARFFADIDVLVFATNLDEAQPTVIFEAFAAGSPVIVYDRGAIREQVGEAGFVIAQGADFTAGALAALKRYQAEPALLEAHRLAARRRYLDDQSQGEAQIARLFQETPVAAHVSEVLPK